MDARYSDRYKRLLLAKEQELSVDRAEAQAVVPPGGSQGDLIDQANADTEAELQIRLHRTDARLLQGIEEALARIRRGTFGVCELCKHPSRPLLGYRNNKLEHTIEIDPEKAPLAKRMFELYAGGLSLSGLGKTLKEEFGVNLVKGYLEKLLKNPFYVGTFYWEGRLYPGTQTPLISRDLFEQVQAVFRGHNKPKYQKHQFAFGGLLRCAYDNCQVTAEFKKNRYTYYRCTGYRGKCALPYLREEELGNRLGQILKDIYIPDDILVQLEQSLLQDKGHADAQRKVQGERLNQRLAQVRGRIERAYLDKLDGKISLESTGVVSKTWTSPTSCLTTSMCCVYPGLLEFPQVITDEIRMKYSPTDSTKGHGSLDRTACR